MKAKDLRGKNIEEIEDVNKAEPAEEEDAVAAAYENISKRLESLREGKEDEEEKESRVESRETSDKEGEEEEIELTEWKGPRKPTKEDLVELEEESDTHELRKVKLKNLENAEEDEEEIDPLDDEDEEEKESRVESREVKEDIDREDSGKRSMDWEPEENDPLDEEEEVSIRKREVRENSDLEDESEEEPKRGTFSDNLEAPQKEETAVSDEADMPADHDRIDSEIPDSREFRSEEAEEDLPKRRDPDSLDDLTDDKPKTISQMAVEDDYFIPNLKGSRQREVDMSYNAHPQTGGVGDSYAPRQNNMENNDPNSFFSQHQPQPPKRANKFHLLILVVIGVAVIGFTVYILKGGFGDINLGSTASPSPSPVVESTPEPTPTATPAPEINKSDFTVRVLNGTGTSGLARTISDKLKEAGYETANPGNAANDDMKQTEIRVKEGTESAALFESLKADLAPDYEAVQGDNLSKSTSYDAEVIIGAK